MSQINQTYVTVLSSDGYLPGVLALARNIRETCGFPLLVLTSRDLAPGTCEQLRRRGIPYVHAADIEAPEEMLNATREHSWYKHWAKSLFKLRIFDLVEYDKIVFVDCDMMLLEPVDEVFEYPDLSAVIAGGAYPGNENWTDLNSGFMAIVPRAGLSDSIAATIPEVAAEKAIFGDQDLMQAYFTDWRQESSLHMPGGYNVFFDHYQFYAKRCPVKAVHFIGSKKPWMMNTFQIARAYLKCLVKGNRMGIPVLRRYLKLLKEVGSD